MQLVIVNTKHLAMMRTLTLSKRPRSNKIIHQCLVALLIMRCWMFYHMPDQKDIRRVFSKMAEKKFNDNLSDALVEVSM